MDTSIIFPYLYCEYDLDFTILPSFVLPARKLTSEYDSSPFNWLKWSWKPGSISIQIKSRHSYAIKGEEERSCKFCAISHGRPQASVLRVELPSDWLTDRQTLVSSSSGSGMTLTSSRRHTSWDNSHWVQLYKRHVELSSTIKNIDTYDEYQWVYFQNTRNLTLSLPTLFLPFVMNVNKP